MNTNELLNLSVAKLRRMAGLKAQIERLQSRLSAMAGKASAPAGKPVRKRRKMSAAARRKISLAKKARWAKAKAGK